MNEPPLTRSILCTVSRELERINTGDTFRVVMTGCTGILQA